MTEATPTTPAAEAAKPAKAKAKKATAKKMKDGAAKRATKVSAAAAKDKAAAKKAQAKNDKAISNGRKPKEKREPGPRKLLGLDLTTKIKYGADADGKRFSQENNPKRDGTNAAKVWKKYANATMTIQGAIDAGVPRTFVLHDLRYGYMEAATK